MIGFPIASGFIDFAKVDFACPYCGKKYSDADDKYLNRCNKNKNHCTRVVCGCGHYFFMTYDQMSEAVAFK